MQYKNTCNQDEGECEQVAGTIRSPDESSVTTEFIRSGKNFPFPLTSCFTYMIKKKKKITRKR